MIFDRPVTPRATRTADMAASVPDETNLTFSIDGTAAATVSAISISRIVGRAEARAQSRAVDHGRSNLGMRVAENHRAPRADIIDVCVAIDVVKIRPGSSGDERGFAADGAKGAAGLLTPPGITRLARDERLMAHRKLEAWSRQGGGGCSSSSVSSVLPCSGDSAVC